MKCPHSRRRGWVHSRKRGELSEGCCGAGDEGAGCDVAGHGEEDHLWQAMEIIGISDRQTRRWRGR